MSFFMIMYVIFAHWFADFVLQTDWQAKNKSKNNFALLKHVGSYTAAMCVFGYLIGFGIEWALFNGVLHFATDYVTSRMTSYLWSKGRVHDFFVVVGFDQYIHYSCLFGTAFYWGLV